MVLLKCTKMAHLANANSSDVMIASFEAKQSFYLYNYIVKLLQYDFYRPLLQSFIYFSSYEWP